MDIVLRETSITQCYQLWPLVIGATNLWHIPDFRDEFGNEIWVAR
jgi:hypothetical protein